MNGNNSYRTNSIFFCGIIIGAEAEILPLRFFYWFFGGHDMAALWIYLIAQLFAPPTGDGKGATSGQLYVDFRNKFCMENKLKQNTEPRHDTKQPVRNRFSDGYSEECKLKTQAARSRSLSNSGRGKPHNPLPQKRLEELTQNLED